MEKKDKESDNGQCIAIGLCLGVTFGILFDNLAMGIVFGMLFGVVLGGIINHQNDKNGDDISKMGQRNR